MKKARARQSQVGLEDETALRDRHEERRTVGLAGIWENLDGKTCGAN